MSRYPSCTAGVGATFIGRGAAAAKVAGSPREEREAGDGSASGGRRAHQTGTRAGRRHRRPIYSGAGGGAADTYLPVRVEGAAPASARGDRSRADCRPGGHGHRSVAHAGPPGAPDCAGCRGVAQVRPPAADGTTTHKLLPDTDTAHSTPNREKPL